MTPDPPAKVNAHPPGIVDAYGRPARDERRRACPRCGGTDRVLSAGFGEAVHDVCGRCGYEFAERTH
jgi:ribosomal protein S27AE